MKKTQIVRICSFLLLVTMLFCCLSHLLVLNNIPDKIRVRGFLKEPEQSIDVALIGASQIYTGYCAPLAYAQCGFTSYGISLSSLPGSMYLPILKECQTRQTPKLYVFEIYGFFYDQSVQEGETWRRNWYDSLPLSWSKWTSIRENIPAEDWLDYLLPITKYHGNWLHPKQCLRALRHEYALHQTGYSLAKGFSTTALAVPEKDDAQKEPVGLSQSGEAHLKRLLEYCKEEGLTNVLFVRWPNRSTLAAPDTYTKVQTIIESYGYSFLDFSAQMDEIGIDRTADFASDEHLNVFGMEKMTSFFADYIMTNFEMHPSHSKQLSDQWDVCAAFMEKALEYCKEETRRNSSRQYYYDETFAAPLQKADCTSNNCLPQ